MTEEVLSNVPRIGMGCWAIGGEFWQNSVPLGYSGGDDTESRRAIEAAWDAGVRVFDTAAVYGTGHSESLLGETLGNRQGSILITKFGFDFEEPKRQVTGSSHDAASIRKSAESSLTRLNRDAIDVLLCHINTLEVADVPMVFDTLERLRHDGLIRSYGWSTDFPERLESAAGYPGFSGVEHTMNLFFDAPSLSRVAEQHGVAQILRSPLAMGLLTGKFQVGDRVPDDDVRSNTFDWMDYFKDGVVSTELLSRLETVRELLTTGGRTVAQGALCWLLARSGSLLPVPGMRTVAQAKENAAALEFGPLPENIMVDIESVIERPEEGPARER